MLKLSLTPILIFFNNLTPISNCAICFIRLTVRSIILMSKLLKLTPTRVFPPLSLSISFFLIYTHNRTYTYIHTYIHISIAAHSNPTTTPPRWPPSSSTSRLLLPLATPPAATSTHILSLSLYLFHTTTIEHQNLGI
ncbi:hypothetical protein LguiB_015407 [Lonicera macranthoides]